MIDTILAVGFAAATFAAVSSDDDEGDEQASAVSTLGVGTATTAAFIASAAHGHNSIQSCLALRQKNSQTNGLAKAPAQPSTLLPGAAYAGPVSAAAH